VEPHLAGPIVDQRSERSLRHLYPETDEAQESLREDCVGDGKREGNYDGAQGVRYKMLPNEPGPSRPQRARGQGELLLFELQHPAPYEKGHVRPAGYSQCYCDREDPRLEDGHRQDGYHQGGAWLSAPGLYSHCK